MEEINSGGSDRRFLRCRQGKKTFILIQDENIDRYIELQQHLIKNRVAVPELYWYDINQRVAGVEDLGRDSLYKIFNKECRLDYYHQAIDELIKFQIDAHPDAPTELHYDAEHIRWEQEYFENFFLKQFCHLDDRCIKPIYPELEDIARIMLHTIKSMGDFLMHRDYQSTNIFIKQKKIRIIDFQSARHGPLGYDLASLLKDPYVSLTPKQELELFDYYLRCLASRDMNYQRLDFIRMYQYCALQRIMQALGAYANLALNKKKSWFKQFIPAGLRILIRDLKSTPYKKFLNLLRGIDLNAI